MNEFRRTRLEPRHVLMLRKTGAVGAILDFW